MESNELLALLTISAVAPYLAEAAVRWIKNSAAHASRAGAPVWCRYPTMRTRN